MFHLLRGLYQKITAKDNFQVLILGLDAAGKTTLLELIKATYTQHLQLQPSQIAPTVGQNIGRITLSRSDILFWDVGGQVDLRRLWTSYYSASHAIVFLLDSAAPQRLNEAWQVLGEITRDSRLRDVPILVLANKQDEANALSVEQLKSSWEESGARPETDIEFLPISALKGNGVREAVDWLFLRVQNSRKAEDVSW
ncbi:P-loop containing nucleoside triphosphate hydrolase protein [Atractiella rhizophila]|nr:P-loop containing nucleoside triphosphate hydrolase protein [Atractiella rhizophila]